MSNDPSTQALEIGAQAVVENANAVVKSSPAQLSTAADFERLAENPAAMAGMLLKTAIEKGVTEENIGVAERVLAMIERLDGLKAKREWFAAFAQLQLHMPKVAAAREVPDKHGVTKYTYASHEDIMTQLQPYLTQYGFAVSYQVEAIGNNEARATIFIMHKAGHMESRFFSVSRGSGPPGATGAQTDGSNATYAKRYATCHAFNIQIDKDNDGGALGEDIGAEAAKHLRQRVKNAGSDERLFLQFAIGKDTQIPEGQLPDDAWLKLYSTIKSEALPRIDDMLSKKEAKKK